MRGCNLTNVDFTEANLERCDLDDALLDEVRFTAANLDGVRGLPETAKGPPQRGPYR